MTSSLQVLDQGSDTLSNTIICSASLLEACSICLDIKFAVVHLYLRLLLVQLRKLLHSSDKHVFCFQMSSEVLHDKRLVLLIVEHDQSEQNTGITVDERRVELYSETIS